MSGPTKEEIEKARADLQWKLDHYGNTERSTWNSVHVLLEATAPIDDTALTAAREAVRKMRPLIASCDGFGTNGGAALDLVLAASERPEGTRIEEAVLETWITQLRGWAEDYRKEARESLGRGDQVTAANKAGMAEGLSRAANHVQNEKNRIIVDARMNRSTKAAP